MFGLARCGAILEHSEPIDVLSVPKIANDLHQPRAERSNPNLALLAIQMALWCRVRGDIIVANHPAAKNTDGILSGTTRAPQRPPLRQQRSRCAGGDEAALRPGILRF